MNKDLDAHLRRSSLRPRRELSTNFTAETLAKALGSPASHGWFKGIFMKQALLKPAPILVALGVVLTISTAAYAAFNWQQIEVLFTGSHTNKTFNAEELGFDYKTCDALGGNNHLRYGVSKAAEVSPKDVEAAIKARCELAQARQLFKAQADWQSKTYMADIKQEVSDYQLSQAIFSVDHIEGDQLFTSLIALDEHSKPLNRTSQEMLAKDVRVYQDGKQVAKSTLKAGDKVVKAQYFYSENGVIQERVVGLIKVKAEAVDPTLLEKVFEIMPCQGNPDTTCLDAPSSAIMGNGFNAKEGEGGNFERRKDIQLASDLSNTYKIQGFVAGVDAGGVTLQAFESDRTFRLLIPAGDRTRQLNQGEIVAVMYLQQPTENHAVIHQADIVQSLVLQMGGLKK